jgi:fatty-acyl-CoA synthase
LPTTATAKILKQSLRAERWQCDDPVWWRPQPADPLRRLTADDCEELRQQFDRHGRLHVLELP